MRRGNINMNFLPLTNSTTIKTTKYVVVPFLFYTLNNHSFINRKCGIDVIA